MARFRPTDLILGGTIGLGGAIYGLNRSVTIIVGVAALVGMIGVEYLWRRF